MNHTTYLYQHFTDSIINKYLPQYRFDYGYFFIEHCRVNYTLKWEIKDKIRYLKKVCKYVPLCGRYNWCIMFEFNDKSLYSKNYFEKIRCVKIVYFNK